MKKFYILMFTLFVFGSSCQKSQFSTTTRQYRNGRVTYVNNHHKERSNTSKFKSPKNHLHVNEPQNDSPFVYRIDMWNLPEPGIKKINPITTSEYENLIVSTTNHRTNILMNESRDVPNSEKIVLHINHSNYRSDNFYINIDKSYLAKKEVTKTKGHNTKKIEPFSLTGFILSILGLIPVIGLLLPSAASWMFFGGLLIAILGVIFGAVGLKRFNRNQAHFKGKGFAVAGIILGILTFVSSIIILIVAISNFNLG